MDNNKTQQNELLNDLIKITQSLPVAAHIIRIDKDENLTIEYGREAIHKIYGVTDPNADDITVLRGCPYPEDLERMDAAFEKSLKEKSVFEQAWRIMHPTDGETWVECNAQPEARADGSTCWYGYIQNVTKIKQTEQQNLSLICYLEKLDIANRALQTKSQLSDVVVGVLDALLQIFDAEQAVLAYPCDPEANEISHLFNRVKPNLVERYDAVRTNIATNARVKSLLSTLVETGAEISGHRDDTEELFLPFPVRPQSYLAIPIQPKLGKPWMLAVHQCSEKREWNAAEKLLLTEIGSRLSEALVSLIATNDLKASEERFRQMAESIEEVFWLIDTNIEKPDLLYVSPGFEKIWGIPAAELYKDPNLWWDAVPEDDQLAQRKLVEFYLDTEREHDEIEIEYRVISRNGSVHYVREKAFPVKNEYGEVYRFAGIAQDITQKKKQDAQIEHLAFHDALTGLDNRASIIETLRRQIYLCDNTPKGLAVLFIDLDGFKAINDSLGHLAGDRLLEKVGKKLNKLKGQENFIGRVGGDEFIIIVRDAENPKTVANTADTILKALQRPFMVLNHELHIGASIGISMCPRDSSDAETLIQYADNALYAAKASGRNRTRFFSPELDAKIRARHHMETDLRHAIERQELSLYYQIQIDASTNNISGVEALLRWQHPISGFVSPAEFIPLAEESGLIIPIGEWVLEQACQQVIRWHEQGLKPLVMSVNISRKQLDEQKFASTVRNIIERTGCSPEAIELEITESSAMSNPKRAIKKLRVISDMGLQLALDDFGTGYSNLAYLKRFPFDRLKIDQSFISDLPEDGDDAAIVQTIILLAKQLRLKVIAEGVETKEQEQFLLNNGCAEMQGYLYSKPVPAEEATKKLKAAFGEVKVLDDYRKEKSRN